MNKDGCINFDGSVSENSLGRPKDSISDLLLQTEEEIKVEKNRIKESLLFSLLNLLLVFLSLLRVCACLLFFFLTISPHFLHPL